MKYIQSMRCSRHRLMYLVNQNVNITAYLVHNTLETFNHGGNETDAKFMTINYVNKF